MGSSFYGKLPLATSHGLLECPANALLSRSQSTAWGFRYNPTKGGVVERYMQSQDCAGTRCKVRERAGRGMDSEKALESQSGEGLDDIFRFSGLGNIFRCSGLDEIFEITAIVIAGQGDAEDRASPLPGFGQGFE